VVERYAVREISLSRIQSRNVRKAYSHHTDDKNPQNVEDDDSVHNILSRSRNLLGRVGSLSSGQDHSLGTGVRKSGTDERAIG
jgi:hypothetical protein